MLFRRPILFKNEKFAPLGAGASSLDRKCALSTRMYLSPLTPTSYWILIRFWSGFSVSVAKLPIIPPDFDFNFYPGVHVLFFSGVYKHCDRRLVDAFKPTPRNRKDQKEKRRKVAPISSFELRYF